MKIAIEQVAGWLDDACVESAQARVDEAHATRSKGLRALAIDVSEVPFRSCLHESGHAVGGFFGGLTIERARGCRGGGGSVEYAAADSSPDILLAMTCADLAGAFAELHFGVGEGRRFELAHSPDILQARLRIDSLRALGPEWNLPTRVFATLAACTISTRWRSIERVAACLAAVGELSGVEVAALCGRAQ